jgi:putative ABC transport system permease protein
LKHGGSARTSVGRLRSAFVAAEVTLCVVLTAATALFFRAALRASTLDPVLPVQSLFTIDIDDELHGYSGARREALFAEIERRLADLPDVVATAMVDNPPFGNSRGDTVLRPADRPDGPGVTAWTAKVSPRFFGTAGIPLLQGRGPSPGGSGEIVVNATLARQLWGDADPIGQRVTSGSFDRRHYAVVGVSRDVPYLSLKEGLDPIFFTGFNAGAEGVVIVRTRGPAAPVARAAVARIEEIDRALTVTSQAMSSGLDDELSSARDRVRAVGMVSALALLLAAIGIASVTSQVVVDRGHEIGVRMALGARGRDAVLLLVVTALRPVAAGVILGTVAAALAARALSSQLYGLSPGDPLAFAMTALLLAAVAALAAFLPARRAAAVDPLISLRAE